MSVRYFDTHDETVEKWVCPQCEKHEVSGVVVYSRDGEMLKIRWLKCASCGWDQMS